MNVPVFRFVIVFILFFNANLLCQDKIESIKGLHIGLNHNTHNMSQQIKSVLLEPMGTVC